MARVWLRVNHVVRPNFRMSITQTEIQHLSQAPQRVTSFPHLTFLNVIPETDVRPHITAGMASSAIPQFQPPHAQ